MSSVWTLQTVVLDGRSSVLLYCMNSPNGECRSLSYGVVNIRKSFGESLDCMNWQEGMEIRNGQTRRGVVSSLSFSIGNCIVDSN